MSLVYISYVVFLFQGAYKKTASTSGGALADSYNVREVPISSSTFEQSTASAEDTKVRISESTEFLPEKNGVSGTPSLSGSVDELIQAGPGTGARGRGHSGGVAGGAQEFEMEIQEAKVQ